MTQLTTSENNIMDIEENDESYDTTTTTNHQETVERFHATMDQQRHPTNHTAGSRIIQSDSIMQMDMNEHDEIDPSQPQPQFPKLTLQQQQQSGGGTTTSHKYKIEYRRIRCPSHRYTPLREHWEQILTPLVEYLKLQVRFFFVWWFDGLADPTSHKNNTNIHPMNERMNEKNRMKDCFLMKRQVLFLELQTL